jgi:molybdopterin converting factor subunit 1
MRVKVLFFGMLKDVTGLSKDTLELPESARLADAFQSYAQRFPKLHELASSIVIARNHEFSPRDTLVSEGDEIAFMPPVSGGSDISEISTPDGHYFALTRNPIQQADLEKRLQQTRDGAIISFSGVVRDNTKGRQTLWLDYEGYEELALTTMAAIGIQIAQERQISRIGIVHRLGRLEIGEASVVITVASPHRKPAFDAAFDAINRLKQQVPIWKKEYFADGEAWVEGEWASDAPVAAGD